jgi:hypothetical protein
MPDRLFDAHAYFCTEVFFVNRATPQIKMIVYEKDRRVRRHSNAC